MEEISSIYSTWYVLDFIWATILKQFCKVHIIWFPFLYLSEENEAILNAYLSWKLRNYGKFYIYQMTRVLCSLCKGGIEAYQAAFGMTESDAYLRKSRKPERLTYTF